MMKFWMAFLVGCMCFLGSVGAQVSVSWAKSYEKDKFTYLKQECFKQVDEHFYFVTFEENSSREYFGMPIFVKMNASGKIVNKKYLDLPNEYVEFESIHKMVDNSFLIFGRYSVSKYKFLAKKGKKRTSKDTYFCIKVDFGNSSNKITLFNSKKVINTKTLYACSDFLLVSFFVLEDANKQAKCLIRKIDSDGNILIEKKIDFGNDCTADKAYFFNNFFYIVMNCHGTDKVFKMNNEFIPVQNLSLLNCENSADAGIIALESLSNGDLIFAANHFKVINDLNDFEWSFDIVYCDSNWYKKELVTYVLKENAILVPITVLWDKDLNPILCGRKIYDVPQKSDINFWIAKLDKHRGQIIWQRELGGSGYDWPYSFAFGSRGEIVVTGTMQDEYTGEKSLCVIELREDSRRIVDNIAPKVWAVVVGVSEYGALMQKKGMGDLKYARNDADQFYRFLQSAEGGAVPKEQIRFLTNKEATRKAVLQNARELFDQAAPRDLIVFYFAGHGRPGEFIAHDYPFTHEEIKNLLAESPAKKRLCIADACYSGSLTPLNLGLRPEDTDPNTEKELTRRYYEELGHSGDGMAMLLSSSKSETSLEANDLQQGIFSYYCMEGLRGAADSNADKFVTIQELYDFVAEKVSRKAAELGKSQRPQLKGIFDRDMPVSALK